MNRLKQIQAYTLRNGIEHTKQLIVSLLQIPSIPYAHKLFDFIPKPTVFLYNKLIQAYSSHGPHHQCFSLYTQMCLQGCSPNEHSFTFLFSACASLSSHQQGRMLHTHFVKSGFGCDVFALTALVDMYAKLGLLSLARKQFDEMTVRDVPTWNSMIAGYARCGDLEGALELFRLMPARNVTSWTAMISGYAQNGQYAKALSMFLMMEEETEMRPNEVTLASVLPACANLGALEVGERIEVYARGNGYFKNLYVSNALLEMYARCGRIDKAWGVFEEIDGRRNLCSWNSMIMGLAVHGRCDEAIELFYKMLREGAAPDDVTFVGVLLACTHGGMVVEGQHFFESMERDFSIAPKLEHYGCMVDLLGPGALFELEPSNPGNYVILSNIYATAGRWDGVARLRKLMKGGKITKAAGYSFIEEGGHIHKFIVEDRSHSRSDEIYALLDEVSMKMKLHGNVNDSDSEIETACLMVFRNYKQWIQSPLLQSKKITVFRMTAY
ncbi:unnamed protein product, partial [Vitis vinifera]